MHLIRQDTSGWQKKFHGCSTGTTDIRLTQPPSVFQLPPLPHNNVSFQVPVVYMCYKFQCLSAASCFTMLVNIVVFVLLLDFFLLGQKCVCVLACVCVSVCVCVCMCVCVCVCVCIVFRYCSQLKLTVFVNCPFFKNFVCDRWSTLWGISLIYNNQLFKMSAMNRSLLVQEDKSCDLLPRLLPYCQVTLPHPL